MTISKASLPDPSGLGFFVTLLVICVLIIVNSVATSTVFAGVENSGVEWLKNPRVGQPLLFLIPLLLLVIELWLASIVAGRFRRRTNTSERR